MLNLNIYREAKTWKKPLHATRTQLAKSYLKLLPNLEVVGITGSVGKTLTQNAIYSVLSQKYKTVVGEEDLDPTYRIPQTILKAKPWDQKLILEYGIEHPGDMDHYLEIARPKIAVVTLISPTHTKYFGNIEGVFEEKAKLISVLPKDGFAILNADDPYCHKMTKLTKAKIAWYGKKAKAGVKVSHFAQSVNGSKFRLHYQGQKATVTTKLIGIHQLTSIYCAATIGLISALTLKQIAKGLSQIKPPLHRLNSIITKKINIIDDTYNSSPKAAQEAVNTLLDLGKRKTKIAVFGEMKDLGKLARSAHEDLGKKVGKSSINYLITIGETAKIIANSAKKEKFRGKIINLNTTRNALSELKKIADHKSLLLVKGSRHAHLDRVVYGLLGKSTAITCYHCGNLR